MKPGQPIQPIMKSSIYRQIHSLLLGAVLLHPAFVRGEAPMIIKEIAKLDQIADAKQFFRSADGKHHAFLARRGSRKFIVFDGRPGPAFQSLERMKIVGLDTGSNDSAFTADGSRFVYAAKKGGNLYLCWIDEDGYYESPPLLGIDAVVLSPAGRSIAAVVTPANASGARNNSHVLFNGALSRQWEYVDPKHLYFSKDGKDFIYVGRVDGRPYNSHHPVWNGRIGPAFPGDSGLTFLNETDNGRELCVFTSASTKSSTPYRLVHLGSDFKMTEERVDGHFHGTSDRAPSLAIAANGSGYAYFVSHDRRNPPFKVIHNGQEVASYDNKNTSPQNLTISPDGKRLAFTVFNNEGVGQNLQVWMDGKPGMDYATCSPIIFSPDSSRAAYIAGVTVDNRMEYYVVEGDEELGPYSKVESLMFGPNGQLTYIGRTEDPGEIRVYVDGKPGPVSDHILNNAVRYHADGKRVIYMTHEKAVVGEKVFQLEEGVDHNGLASRPYPVALSPDGNRYATYMEEGPNEPGVFLDGKPIGPCPTWFVSAFEFSPDSKHLILSGASNGKEETELFIDGKKALAFPNHETPIQGRWGRDGRYSFIAPYENTLALYDLNLDAMAEFGSNLAGAEEEAGLGIVHSFTGGEGGLVEQDSELFEHDGRLVARVNGGAYKHGLIGSVNFDGSDFRAVHPFTGATDGYSYHAMPAFMHHLCLIARAKRGNEPSSVWLTDLRGGEAKLVLETKEQIHPRSFFPLAPDAFAGTNAGSTDLFRIKVSEDGPAEFGKFHTPVTGNHRMMIEHRLQSLKRELESLQSLAKTNSPEAEKIRKEIGEVKSELARPNNMLSDDWSDRMTRADDGWIYGAVHRQIYRIKDDGSDAGILHEFKGAPDGDGADGRVFPVANGRLAGFAEGDHGGLHLIYTMKRDGTDYQALSLPEKMREELRSAFMSDGGPIGPLLVTEKAIYHVLEKSLKPLVELPKSSRPVRSSIFGAKDGRLYGLAEDIGDYGSIFRVNLGKVDMPEMKPEIRALAENAEPWPAQTIRNLPEEGAKGAVQSPSEPVSEPDDRKNTENSTSKADVIRPEPAIAPAGGGNAPPAMSPEAESAPEKPHTLGTVFNNGPYANYNAYSRQLILRRAQDKLKEAGFYHGAIDGAMGPNTQAAIIAWQRNAEIPANGLLDEKTLQNMYLLGFAEQSPPPKAVQQRPPPQPIQQRRQPPPPRRHGPDTEDAIRTLLDLIPR